jgi:hypothetical protein
MINTDINNQVLEEPPASDTKPDDLNGIYIRGFLKITDPESGQTIVETGN